MLYVENNGLEHFSGPLCKQDFYFLNNSKKVQENGHEKK